MDPKEIFDSSRIDDSEFLVPEYKNAPQQRVEKMEINTPISEKEVHLLKEIFAESLPDKSIFETIEDVDLGNQIDEVLGQKKIVASPTWNRNLARVTVGGPIPTDTKHILIDSSKSLELKFPSVISRKKFVVRAVNGNTQHKLLASKGETFNNLCDYFILPTNVCYTFVSDPVTKTWISF